jgi:hypothetical protein
VETESETVPGQPTARVLTPYGIDGARTGRQPARRRCGATPARQLLGAAPVDQQQKMRAVLLDRAERKEHDGAWIAGNPCGAG